MTERLNSTNISPGPGVLNNIIRATKIHVGGKIMHLLLGSNTNLVKSGKKFLEAAKIKTQINESSLQSIQEFEKNGYGLMILNHPNGNFSDYLPFFAQLKAETLEKTIFLVGKHNVAMMSKRFPELKFVAVTFDNFGEGAKFLGKPSNNIEQETENIETIVEKLEKKEKFIFIIPMGATPPHETFKGIFRRLIDKIDENTPLLCSKVDFSSPLNYGEIYSRVLSSKISPIIKTKENTINCTLSSINSTIKPFKGKGNSEMFGIYTGLTKK